MLDLLRVQSPLIWAGFFAAITLVIGLVLLLTGRRLRRSRGLGQGRTIELDDRKRAAGAVGSPREAGRLRTLTLRRLRAPH